MGSSPRCMRHFKALMRKNFILWYRTPCRSISTLVCPVILMVALAVIRHFVPYFTVDGQGLLNYQYFNYAASEWYPQDSSWSNNTDTNPAFDQYLNPYSRFVNYQHGTGPDNYQAGYDPWGPQFWYPTQCVREFSLQVPRRASPGIALVGEYESGTDLNDITYRM